MRETKTDFIEQTTDFWQPRASRELTCEDARQIVENITGFFDTLLKWKTTDQTDPETPTKPILPLDTQLIESCRSQE